MKKKTLRILSMCLVFVLLLSQILSAAADTDNIAFEYGIYAYDKDNNEIVINCIESNNTLYLNAQDVARVKGSHYLSNDAFTGYIAANSARLGIVEEKDIYSNNGDDYVEFSVAAKINGLVFKTDESGKCRLTVSRTPSEFFQDVRKVFSNSEYRKYNMIIGDYYWIEESAARVYTILSSMSLSKVIDTITGEFDDDLFRDALLELAVPDGKFKEVVETYSDIDKGIAEPLKIVTVFKELMDEGGEMSAYLKENGWSDSEIDLLRTDYLAKFNDLVCGDDVSQFLYGLSEFFSALKVVPIEEILDFLNLLATAMSADEQIILAMDAVFSNCDNTHLSTASNDIVAIYQNNALGGLLVGTEEAGKYTIKELIKAAEKGIQELAGVGAEHSAKKKLIEITWKLLDDHVMHVNSAAKTTINNTVLAQIQLCLEQYYYQNNADYSAQNAQRIQAVAILYLRTFMKIMENGYFDYYGSTEINRLEEMAGKDLALVMGYTEEELAGNFDSTEFVNLLLYGNQADEQDSSQAAQKELDHTYWMYSYGCTIGTNRVVLLSGDGTAVDCFGDRYTWSYDGETLFFEGVAYKQNGDGFISTTTYFSGAGGWDEWIYYTLTPSDQEAFNAYTNQPENSGGSQGAGGGGETKNDSATSGETQNDSSASGGTQWGAWSEWQDTPIDADANTQVETRTVYGYYYFECPHCGAHMHGWGTVCYPWAGGCGGATPDDSGWHQIWSEIPWDEANLQDWYGTGHYYTYIDGELVFQWTNDGQPKTQYRCRTKTSADAGLADGSYYVEIVFEEVLYEREYLTFDLLEVTGYAPSDNPIFEYAEESYVLEIADGCVIRDSSVFSDDGLTEIYYDDLGPILNQYGFGTIVSIRVFDGKIVYIDKFYMA